MNWVEAAAIVTVLTAPIAIPRSYLYFKDRLVTDIPSQQQFLQETTFTTHGSLISPEVASVHCYPPRAPLKRLARHFFFDYGYTQVKIVLPDTPIKEDYWGAVLDGLEEHGISVQDYGPDYERGGSFLIIEIDGFGSGEVEETVSDIPEAMHEPLRLKRLGEIPDP